MSTFWNLYKAKKKFKKRKCFERCYITLKDSEYCYFGFGILNIANLNCKNSEGCLHQKRKTTKKILEGVLVKDLL